MSPGHRQDGTPDADPDAARGEAGTAGAPVLRVVRGDATAEEVAALVAVLAARSAAAARAAETGPPARPSAWASHRSRLRPALAPGPGAWRACALPH